MLGSGVQTWKGYFCLQLMGESVWVPCNITRDTWKSALFIMSSWHCLWLAALWTRVYRHDTDWKLPDLHLWSWKWSVTSVPLNRIVQIKIMAIIKVQAQWAQRETEQMLSSEVFNKEIWKCLNFFVDGNWRAHDQ